MAETGEQPKLTTRQERFIDAYCGESRFNASDAARRAGYSEKQAASIGCQLKKTPYIRARIDEILQDNTLSAPEVLHELTDVGMRGIDEFIEVTRYDKEGNPVAARMDASAKMKALELLGKHHQLFSDNLNITGGIEVREYVGIPEDQP
jgi:phage terminase small subunit